MTIEERRGNDLVYQVVAADGPRAAPSARGSTTALGRHDLLILHDHTISREWMRAQDIDAGHVVTSKFYPPEQSWTGDDAWWFQVPARAIRDGEAIHMVREAAPNDAAFRYLKVPAEFFEAHRRVSFARWSFSCGSFRLTGECASNTSGPRSVSRRGGVRSPRRARLNSVPT